MDCWIVGEVDLGRSPTNRKGRKRRQFVYRVIYELMRGPIKRGLVVITLAESAM